MKIPLFRSLALLLALVAVALHGQTLTVVGAYAGGENDTNFVNNGVIDSAFDSSGNSQHLSNSGAHWSTVASPGAANFQNGVGSPSTGSYYFDGNDSLSIAAPLTTTTSNWGVEAWVKLDATAGTQSILLNGSGSNGYGLIVYNGTWNGLLGGIAFITGATAYAGVWTHLALIEEDGEAKFYVNGVYKDSGYATANTPTGNFSLGSDLASNYLTGYIDQARVFTYTGTFNPSVLNLSAAAVPEPSAYAALAGVAALGFAAWRRRRRAA